jgi:hypothetical protein
MMPPASRTWRGVRELAVRRRPRGDERRGVDTRRADRLERSGVVVLRRMKG